MCIRDRADYLAWQEKAQAVAGPDEKEFKSLGEGYDVEGDADRLREKEKDANGGPDIQAEGTRNNEILPSIPDLLVGRNLRQGQGRGNGNTVPDQDNQHYPPETQGSGRKTKTQKKDGPQDGGDGRKEDRSRPETLFSHSLHNPFYWIAYEDKESFLPEKPEKEED
jgi:hypothetical protein